MFNKLRLMCNVIAVAGGASGALLFGLGYKSLKQYKKGKLCKPATVASLAIAAGLTFVMYSRYMETKKIFPAFVFMAVSGIMTVYYVWNILLGPVPKSRKS